MATIGRERSNAMREPTVLIFANANHLPVLRWGWFVLRSSTRVLIVRQYTHESKMPSKTNNWYANNREAIRKARNLRYATDQEFRAKAIANSRKYLAENYDKCRKKKREYVASHIEENRQKAKDYYYKNINECKQKMSIYRSKNRDRQRNWSRKRSLEITDGYAREMLSKYSTISAHEWPQELVDAKRIELMCMRLTGDKRYKSLPATNPTTRQP